MEVEYEYTSLYELIVRRIRATNTIFKDNVKLVLRQRDDEHWSSLPLPYLLVVPTVTRPETERPHYEDEDILVVPRSVTLIAQLDGRGSEAEFAAAVDIEIAEKQLIGALAAWRPSTSYMATMYQGMRITGTRLPDVKASLVFVFPEQIGLCNDGEVGVDGVDEVEVDRIVINVSGGCCPPDEPPLGDLPPIFVTPQQRRL